MKPLTATLWLATATLLPPLSACKDAVSANQASAVGDQPPRAVPADYSGNAYWVAALYKESKGGQWQEPQAGELLAFEREASKVMSGQATAASIAEFTRLGWKSSLLEDSAGQLWVLQELPPRREGRGFFVLRAGPCPAASAALQAPHGGADRYTDSLALQLFGEKPFAAAAFNTVPRDQVRAGGVQLSDPAHQERGYFNAVSRAFATACPGGSMLQLHGYSAAGHPAIAGGVVVSSGSQKPSALSRRVAAALAPLRPQIYGEQVHELGGTTNAQGVLLRAAGVDFIHLEMNLESRQQLRARPDLRMELLKCF